MRSDARDKCNGYAETVTKPTLGVHKRIETAVVTFFRVTVSDNT